MAFTSEERKPVKKATTNEEVVALLQDDMKGEHAAIIQYLQHAYKIGDEGGEVTNDIEGIARDEMRHFRWLGELIVELGGDPTMQRDPVFLDAPSNVDMLSLDVDAEQRAIEQYGDHIAAIDHPKVKLYLERILMDEIFHQKKFRGFVAEMGGEKEEGPKNAKTENTGPWNQEPNPPSEDLELDESGEAKPADLERENRNDHPLVKMINSRIKSEYETILVYLHQAFVSTNLQQRNTLISDRAVWHMTHMGDLAEAVSEKDSLPDMEINFDEPFIKAVPTEPNKFKQWSVEREQAYVKSSGELINLAKSEGDDELLEELERIEGHDKFQVEQLKND